MTKLKCMRAVFSFPKEKAILYLTDILGFGLPNAQVRFHYLFR